MELGNLNLETTEFPKLTDKTTCRLEDMNMSRRTVLRAEFLQQDLQGIILRSHAGTFTQPWGFASRGGVEGRIRVDVLAENMFRIRYCEGQSTPENQTPMVTGLPSKGIDYSLTQQEGCLEIRTVKTIMRIAVDPYEVTILDTQGKLITRVSGLPRGHNQDSYNTGLCLDNDPSAPLAVETFGLRPGEAIYGFGERFTNLNKVGQRVDLYASDTMSTSSPRAYKNVPFFVSTHGYGVYFNHTCRMSIWVGSMSACDIQAALDDDFLDYFIFTGTIKEVLHTYTGLTGRGDLPPRWSFGFWQSRFLSSPDIMEMAQKLREHQIPADVLCLDADWMTTDFQVDLEFSQKLFPKPEETMEYLQSKGFQVCAWQMPYVRGGSPLYQKLEQVGGLVRTQTGEPYRYGADAFTGYVVDFTCPEAFEIYKEAIRQVLRAGVRVIKVDFGEAAPIDGVYFGGKSGKNIHNVYPMLYNKAIYEATREVTGEGLIWGRSTWAGSQRYPLHWGGDPQSNFENMITELEGGLSLGLSGFQFWSFDIGGFFGVPTEKFFLRTLQLGMFVSHCRAHGTGNRELYNFSPEILEIGREYHNLRYRMLPYIYAEAQRSIQTSQPMVRALVIDFQDDPTVWNIGDEFLFGDHLLVAPILNEQDERLVYLPAGTWTDWWTGERIQGRQWLRVCADTKTLPLYIREGGVIALGQIMQYVDERPTDAYDLTVSLFEQDGETNTSLYDDGKWTPIRYTCKQGHHQLMVSGIKKGLNVYCYGEGTIEIIID